MKTQNHDLKRYEIAKIVLTLFFMLLELMSLSNRSYLREILSILPTLLIGRNVLFFVDCSKMLDLGV